jgi:hypothetical protein
MPAHQLPATLVSAWFELYGLPDGLECSESPTTELLELWSEWKSSVLRVIGEGKSGDRTRLSI